MISKYNHKELTWIDLESPSEEEIFHIIEQYPIPLYIKEEIMLKTQEDRISLDNDFIFASLYFPQLLISKNKNNKLIFVVSNNFILTIHNEPMQALNIFSKEMELDIITEEKLKISNNRLLFAYLLKSLYVNSQKQLVINEMEVKSLKKQLLQNNKKLKSLTLLSIISLIVIILISLFICL